MEIVNIRKHNIVSLFGTREDYNWIILEKRKAASYSTLYILLYLKALHIKKNN